MPTERVLIACHTPAAGVEGVSACLRDRLCACMNLFGPFCVRTACTDAPQAIAIDPAGTAAYVTDFNNDDVTVLRLKH